MRCAKHHSLLKGECCTGHLCSCQSCSGSWFLQFHYHLGASVHTPSDMQEWKLSTECCKARRGALLWGVGRMTAGHLELCRPSGAGNEATVTKGQRERGMLMWWGGLVVGHAACVCVFLAHLQCCDGSGAVSFFFFLLQTCWTHIMHGNKTD